MGGNKEILEIFGDHFVFRRNWWGDKSCPTEYKGGPKNLECHLTLNDVTIICGHARQQIMTVDGIVMGQRVDVTRDSVRLDLFHKFHFTINVT